MRLNVFITILTLTIHSISSKRGCIVDQCKKCRYINLDQCDQCYGGYYRVSFKNEDRGRAYHACWNTKKLLLSLLLSLLLCLSYLYCIYKCWQKGKNTTKIVTVKKPTQTIDDERKGAKPDEFNIKGDTNLPSTQRTLNMPSMNYNMGMMPQYPYGGAFMNQNMGYGFPAPPPPPPPRRPIRKRTSAKKKKKSRGLRVEIERERYDSRKKRNHGAFKVTLKGGAGGHKRHRSHGHDRSPRRDKRRKRDRGYS